HIARQQHFAVTSHERSQIDNVRIHPHAVHGEVTDAPARQEEVAAPITRDKSGHGRMIFFAQAHDDISARGDTLTVKVEDWSTQNLGQIKHCFDSPGAIDAMITRGMRSDAVSEP